MPVIHQIPTFPIGVNIMEVNGLRRIHITFPPDCVWTLCTVGAGNCVNQTARNILEPKFYVHKNRLALMPGLALHNVITANRDILARFSVERDSDAASHWSPNF